MIKLMLIITELEEQKKLLWLRKPLDLLLNEILNITNKFVHKLFRYKLISSFSVNKWKNYSNDKNLYLINIDMSPTEAGIAILLKDKFKYDDLRMGFNYKELRDEPYIVYYHGIFGKEDIDSLPIDKENIKDVCDNILANYISCYNELFKTILDLIYD